MTVRASRFPINIPRIQEKIDWAKENKDILIKTKKEELRDNLAICKEDRTKFHLDRYISQLIYLLELE